MVHGWRGVFNEEISQTGQSLQACSATLTHVGAHNTQCHFAHVPGPPITHKQQYPITRLSHFIHT